MAIDIVNADRIRAAEGRCPICGHLSVTGDICAVCRSNLEEPAGGDPRGE